MALLKMLMLLFQIFFHDASFLRQRKLDLECRVHLIRKFLNLNWLKKLEAFWFEIIVNKWIQMHIL